MAEQSERQKDWWDRCESFAKIVAGVGAGIGAILIPFAINAYTEQNRNAQLYMQIMTEREKSDTDIRAKMFERLLVNYLGEFKEYANKDDEQAFYKQIMILELLSLNFQEFFDARPLFEEVHRRLVKQKRRTENIADWDELEREIFRVAKNIASRQALTLNALGKSESVNFSVPMKGTWCSRLYDEAEMATLTPQDRKSLLRDNYSGGPCTDLGTRVIEGPPEKIDRKDVRRSIEVYVKKVDLASSTVIVTVTPYEDVFVDHSYTYSRRWPGFEFEVSYFGLPYMDNTKFPDGSRLALLLKDIYKADENSQEYIVEVAAIRFRNDFVSLRDRPTLERMLERLVGQGRASHSD